MTTIWLIRHGETDWNAAGRWQGHTDVPLNDTGRGQAQALAQRIAGWPIQALYSSDLQRAAQTARILAGVLDVAPVHDAGWRERHGGVLQGLTGPEIAAQHPEQWRQLQQGIYKPPGGEAPQELRRRVVASYEGLLARHNDGDVVAVVSHGGTMRTLIGHVLGLPPDRDPPVSVRGNTGLSCIEVSERGPRLTLLNDTSHLGEWFV